MKTKKFLVLLIAVFILLIIQLFRLTVVEGKRYRELSEGQRIRERKIAAARGLIRDRNGEVVARNRPVYKIARSAWQVAGEEEFRIISHEEAIEIEAKGELDAANLRVEVVREYVGGESLAHVIGYTGEVTEEEVVRGAWRIAGGDKVGRMGVEEKYDEILRGVDGKELIETDAEGKPLRVLGKIDPQSGQELTLSIDYSLQEKAAELLKGEKGAVVVSDPENNEILALFSSPSFDSNLFVRDPSTGSERGIGDILEDPETPLFNRAISGVYPPGSVFKIITAAAALEEKAIDKETEIEDVGVIQIGPYRFANWYFTQYGKKEENVNIVKAIQRSNDIFFYKVGEMLGVEKLAKWGRKFWVGKILGIDLPGEESGVMPDPEWKERVKKDSWFLGDTYHLAIGQGGLLATPLQVNFWTGAIANNGKLCQPKVKKLDVQESRLDEDCQKISLKGETISLIKEGMKKACEPGGTGWPLFNFKVGEKEISTGCKTGTAEFGDPEDRTHAWFTVFAPFDDPEIVITVLVEGGGEGSYVAAPIAKEILKEWFGK